MPELQLRPDQITDLGRLLNERKCIHGGQPGTGKTPTICVLQAARWRIHQHKSIWLMPMKLIEKNYREAMAWGGWTEGDVAIVDGSAEECAAIVANPEHKLLLMGFTRFDLVADQIGSDYKGVDVDEWHKGFGGHAASRTQTMYRWCHARGDDLWFVPMTGSLYNGRPATCYPVIAIIEPRYYGTIEAFELAHNIVDAWTGKVTGHDNLDRLQAILNKHSIRHLWTDIHGPEELVTEVVPVRMSKRQRESYDRFREDAVLELETFFVDGTQPGVAFTRARQIMEHPNSFPNLMEGGMGTVDICPGEMPGKLEMFQMDCEQMTELGRPLLAFAACVPQQHEMLEVARKAGRRVGLINGSVSNRVSNQIDTGFQRGELDTIIASPVVADCGFNWQFCGDQEVMDIIFASMDYRDTAFFQAYKRAMREKRSSALRLKIYTYQNSLDQHIMRLTKAKSIDAAKTELGRVPLPW